MTEQMPESEPKKNGVLSTTIENNHHVLRIRWADGTENSVSFPVTGIPLVDPETNQHLGLMSGKEALRLHQEHAPNMTSEEFSLVRFWKEKSRKK